MKHILAILSLSSLVVALFFGEILKAPNTYILGNTGDGLKNYFTAAYYTKYDSGTHFSGLQAPYGNHIVYTDNQPLFSLFIKFIDSNIHPISDYTVGIFNYAMLVSIVITALMVYLILIRTIPNKTYSLITALLITFMSPQLYRMNGHYALSYACFIPLVWYQLILIEEGKRSIYRYGMFFLTFLFFGLLHPYYLLIGAVFILAYIFIHIIRHYKNLSHDKTYLFSLFAACISPIITFQLWIKLTDTFMDRPTNPWGLMDYRSVFEGVFLPITYPLRRFAELIFQNDFMLLFFDLSYQSLESNSYVGLAGTAVLVFIMVRIVRLIRQKRSARILHPVLPDTLRTTVWAGVIVLLFASAYPFRLGMEFLLDILTPLKQFRSLGRFAWVFFYTFSVTMACYIYLLLRNYRMKFNNKFIWAIPVFLLGFWAYECFNTLNNIKPKLYPNVFSAENKYLDTTGLNIHQYQSIITFPLFLSGTEKIDLEGDETTKVNALKIVYESGVPLVSGDMSRVSKQVGENIRQLLSNDLIEKKIYHDFVKNKPILIMAHDETIRKAERRFLNYCKLKKKLNGFSFYELDPNSLPVITSNSKAKKTAASKPSTVFNSNQVVYRSYNNLKSKESFSGNGALLLPPKEDQTIYDGLIPLGQGPDWEISFWHKIDYTKTFPSIFTFEQYNGQNMLSEEKGYFSDNFDLSNGWLLIKKKIKLDAKATRVKIHANNGGILIDELLIRPINKDVYTGSGSNKAYNTYPL